MRFRYLGDLAHLLGMDAHAVDALRCADFFTYVQWIDAYHEAQKKSNDNRSSGQYIRGRVGYG